MSRALQDLYFSRILVSEDIGQGEHPVVTRVNMKSVFVGGPQAGEEYDAYDNTNAEITTQLKGNDLSVRVSSGDFLFDFTVPFNAVRGGVLNGKQVFTWDEKYQGYRGEGIVGESLLADVSTFPNTKEAKSVRVETIPEHADPKTYPVTVGTSYRVVNRVGDKYVVYGNDGSKVSLPSSAVTVLENHQESDMSNPEEREEVTIGKQILAAMVIGNSKSSYDALRKIKPLAERLVNMHQPKPQPQQPVAQVSEAVNGPARYALYGNKTGQIYGTSSQPSIQLAWEEMKSKYLATVQDKDDPLALNPKVVKGDGFYAIAAPHSPEKAFGVIDLEAKNPDVQNELAKRSILDKVRRGTVA
jgi:hypothetical protein